MRSFAPPPPPLPEFMDEAHYLSDFIVRWKLKFQGIEDKEIGVIDFALLARWRKNRAVISAGYYKHKRGHDVIPDLLRFVDVLVIDWFTELAGIPPFAPLDEARMLVLESYWQKLKDIPGDKWEIKY
jgi:hypothetical protein